MRRTLLLTTLLLVGSGAIATIAAVHQAARQQLRNIAAPMRSVASMTYRRMQASGAKNPVLRSAQQLTRRKAKTPLRLLYELLGSPLHV